jgi:hypothetical protein
MMCRHRNRFLVFAHNAIVEMVLIYHVTNSACSDDVCSDEVLCKNRFMVDVGQSQMGVYVFCSSDI